MRLFITLSATLVSLSFSTASPTEPFVCRLEPTADLSVSEGIHEQGHGWGCLRVAGKGPREVTLGSAVEIADAWKEELFLAVDEFVEGMDAIDFVRQARILNSEQAGISINGKKRALRGDDRAMQDRRRTTVVGPRGCGIVIVHGKNQPYEEEPVADLEETLYGKSSQQFEACSKEALWLEEKDPVIEVELPLGLASYTRQTVYDAARKAVCLYYGKPATCEPATERDLDHILYVLPFGVQDDSPNSYWAYADVGGYRKHSVYGGGFFVSSTILHELGHNLNLGHATEEGEYGDRTGQMGGGGGAKRCFNGYNMYTMGWLESQTVALSTIETDTSSLYELWALDDMDLEETVSIKIGDVYLVYNQKKGRNNDTKEYQNEVVIHRGKDIDFGESNWDTYSSTLVLGTLNGPGDCWYDEYNGAADELIICLCSIDTTGTEGATLSIGVNTHSCIGTPEAPSDSEPTGTGGVEGDDISELASGVSVSVSGDKDFVARYAFPLSQTGAFGVRCSISGGSGDADLIVNRVDKGLPVIGSNANDCMPFKAGSNESCEFSGEVDSLYVFVHAYDAIDGVTLMCQEEDSVTAGAGGAVHLQDREAVRNLAAERDDVLHFLFDIPSDADTVSCAITGRNGDADLILRFDGEPAVGQTTLGLNLCYPYQNGSQEFCVGQPVTGSVLFVSVHAYESFTNLILVCGSY